MALHQAGELDRAVQIYRDVLAKDPGQADALHLLGAVHWQKGELDDAEKLIRRSITLWNKEAAYFADLGGVLNQKGAFDEAIAAYQSALRLDPRHKNARAGLLNCYGRKGFEASKIFNWEEAEAAYRKLLEMNPGDAAALNNLGEIKQHAGDRRAAEEFYSQGLAKKPDYDIVRYNRAICRLGLNNLAGGWDDLAASTQDWLQRMDDRKGLPWPRMPLWDGSDLRGKKILIWGNQGIGDEILFSSMFGDLIERGAQVTVDCTGRLVPLFQRAFPGIVANARDGLPVFMTDFDFVAPGLWLGRWLRQDFSQFPKRPAYLKADDAVTERLRARYKAFGKKRITGISWHTKSKGRAEERRLDLIDLAQAIAKKYPLDETLFVDLQYGDTAAERDTMQKTLPSFNLYHDPEVDQLQDMDIYAAQIAACDDVVTIGNTTAHVAGALGVPGQILIPTAGLTWYWFEDRPDCPWYPRLKILRKTGLGDWSAALAGIEYSEFL
jgi:Flp pilus assembly protein TadD